MAISQRNRGDGMSQETGHAAVAQRPEADGERASNGARRLLVDGWLIAGERTFPSLNPATGGLVGHAADASPELAGAAVAAARKAFDTTTWALDRELRV